MEAHRLLSLVINLGLNNKEVDIAAGAGLAASMGAEQDDLRVRSSCSQAAPGLGNQSLVNYLHGRNRSRHLRSLCERAAARKNGAAMAAQDQGHSTSEHLVKMIAKGEVRPGKGPHFLPRPIKTQPGHKAAADWVAEGRR